MRESAEQMPRLTQTGRMLAFVWDYLERRDREAGQMSVKYRADDILPPGFLKLDLRGLEGNNISLLTCKRGEEDCD